VSGVVQASEAHWTVDKRVPLALILALMGQTIGVVWWAASLQSTISEHGRRIVVMEAADARMTTEAQRVSEQLARLDERMAAQTAILRRIEEGVNRQPNQR
jgi:hypothetical protein